MNALILAGGQSTRMGHPKALIEYHAGMPHAFYMQELAQPHCNNTFIGCKPAQESMFRAAGYQGDFVFDQSIYGDIGPMNAVLSAYAHQPCDWLVLACDYPFIRPQDIDCLVQRHHSAVLATVYRAAGTPYCEPLLGIYSAIAMPFLLEWHEKKQNSLQKFLMNHNVQYLSPLEPHFFTNVNSNADYNKALDYFKP